MRFITLVLVPKASNDIISEVSRLMEPYYADLKIQPYREHVDPSLIQEVIRKYDLPVSDLKEIARKLQEWSGDKCGVDEQGVYMLSTINPNGKWDGWILEDVTKWVFSPDALPPTVMASAIVNPDGTWHDLEVINDSNEWERATYWQTVHKFLDSNSDCLVAAIDCHI